MLDLGALKTPPGDYTLAFSGIGVSKYRANQDALKQAESEQKEAGEELNSLATAAKVLAEKAAAAPADEKEEATKAAKRASVKHKAAEAALGETAKRVKTLTDATAPKDILDFVVSEPIRISVKPAPVAQASPSIAPAAPPAATQGSAATQNK